MRQEIADGIKANQEKFGGDPFLAERITREVHARHAPQLQAMEKQLHGQLPYAMPPGEYYDQVPPEYTDPHEHKGQTLWFKPGESPARYTDFYAPKRQYPKRK
jgi:hypothetical protein